MRLLTPLVGSSYIVWTSFLGIILLAISLGNALGGLLATRSSRSRFLPLILVLTGFSALLIIFFNRLGAYGQTNLMISNLPVTALALSLLVFGPTGVLTGIMFPLVKSLTPASVGFLSAVSTLGNLAGVFLTGFLLLPAFNLETLILLSAGIFLIMGLWLQFSLSRFIFLIIIFGGSFLILPPLPPNLVDTPYQRLLTRETTDPVTGLRVRKLVTGWWQTQTTARSDGDPQLLDPYQEVMSLAYRLVSHPQRILVIGGGGYAQPRFYLQHFTDGTIDVIEIDPGITRFAQRFFFLKPDPRLTIYHQDARIFLNSNRHQYDIVLVDAFYHITPPFHLTTSEAVSQIFRSTAADSIVLVNLIGSLSGPRSKFIASEYLTYSRLFPEVQLIPAFDNQPDRLQNIILIAAKQPLPDTLPATASQQLQKYFSNRRKITIPPGTPTLTDSYAPVENMTLSYY